jgi:hypothetical protein
MFVGHLPGTGHGSKCLGPISEEIKQDRIVVNPLQLEIGSVFQKAKLKELLPSPFPMVQHGVIMSLLPLGNTVHVCPPPPPLLGWLEN